jgi:phospholipase C
MKRILTPIVLIAAVAVIAVGGPRSSRATQRGNVSGPIQHVVIIFQENHSFDEMLGLLCVQENNRCDGTTVGEISDGQQIPLKPGGDIPPEVGHKHEDQVAAINDGQMNGWDHVWNCETRTDYQCLQQVDRERVPTLWGLADQYVISDRTFELDLSATWGSHLELVTTNLDGFIGDNPDPPVPGQGGKGTGCDSKNDALWTNDPNVKPILVPSCIPDKRGRGPYRDSPVQYIRTIMDRMEAAGVSWRIYSGGYGRCICPSFYECLNGPQAKNVLGTDAFFADAQAGTLPNFSIVIPSNGDSQHNERSLIRGDNWIASLVNAVGANPDMWNSSAIFITYDDCGCFYDHVLPPTGLGIREPMVIVSPWAKPGYVDHNVASYASLLAFAEKAFRIRPLAGGRDGTAYNYSDSFNYSQRPLPPIHFVQHRVPLSSIRYEATHPLDPDDPT